MRVINALNWEDKAPLFPFSPTAEEGAVNWTAFISAEFHGITSLADLVDIIGSAE
jgi:hypothetical protein